MSEENEKSYTQHQFSVGKPLCDEEKELMLKKIRSSLKRVFDIMGMCNELRPGDSEEDRIKRVFMFTSNICGFIVDWLEEEGAAVILDKEHAQAILTELTIPMPAMIEGFATDLLKDM